MEITNEERREVAQKLRDIKRVDFGDGLVCLNYDLDEVLGFDWADEDHIFDYHVKRLADLIYRPTCHIIKDVETPEHPWGTCSRCSALVDSQHATSSATEYLPTRFCPNCGAEVVE